MGEIAERSLHPPPRARAKHNGFQERITCQPVCAMNARAGRLARRKESRKISLAEQVRSNAAHGVMSRGAHRSGRARKIDSMLETRLVDTRESITDKAGRQMRQIEKRAFVIVRAHLGDNRSRNNIPRREFRQADGSGT